MCYQKREVGVVPRCLLHGAAHLNIRAAWPLTPGLSLLQDPNNEAASNQPVSLPITKTSDMKRSLALLCLLFF